MGCLYVPCCSMLFAIGPVAATFQRAAATLKLEDASCPLFTTLFGGPGGKLLQKPNLHNVQGLREEAHHKNPKCHSVLRVARASPHKVRTGWPPGCWHGAQARRRSGREQTQAPQAAGSSAQARA